MTKDNLKKPKRILKIFLIAGEISGDVLGGKLISSIKKQSSRNSRIRLLGIGGSNMKVEGLKSIFPMNDLSLFGLAEVIPHIPKILKRINQTVTEIQKFQPDILITIDAPDFCFRVAKKLNKLDKQNKIKKVHMIAPSVWAYREGRAKKIAQLYNLLLTILPFEPPYFEKYGLKSKFIGHPIVENKIDKSKLLQKRDFYNKYNLPNKNDIICLTPGSRIGEVNRLLPIFLDAVRIIQQKHKNLSIGIATTDKIEGVVRTEVNKFKDKTDNVTPHLLRSDKKKNIPQQVRGNISATNLSVAIVKDIDDKNSLYRLSRVAIAKSGTNTFELMMAKLPMVVCYKFNWLTGKIGRRIIKVKYCNLANIILNKEIIPELVQESCSPELIAKKVKKLMFNKSLIQKQISGTQKVLKILGVKNKEKSSDLGAKYILELISK
ncbi:lipid-A-disaccharide synthase [Pseudomonadota bacterium]